MLKRFARSPGTGLRAAAAVALAMGSVLYVPGCGGDDGETALADLTGAELAQACEPLEREFEADEQAQQGHCKRWAAVVGYQDDPALPQTVAVGPALCELLLPSCPVKAQPYCTAAFDGRDCDATLKDLQECSEGQRALLRSYAPLSCEDARARLLGSTQDRNPNRKPGPCDAVAGCFPFDFTSDGAAGVGG